MIALNYLYLSSNHAGGKDQVGLNLLRGLYENGWSEAIIVFCYDYSKKILEKIAPSVKIVTVRSKIKNELYRIVDLYYVNTFIIPELIRKYNIDLIYHLSINNGLKKMKVSSIVTPHDIKQISNRKVGNVHIPFYKYYAYKLMYHLDFKHADKIIAISEFDKSDMCSYYPQFAQKIERIYNPISIPQFNAEIESERKEKYIIAINLQFHHKNIITLIKAFEILQDKIEHNLVLVGNVPKRVKYLKEYTINHNLQNRIRFTGFVQEKERNVMLQNAELYVNPSMFEGFGMTNIEAMLLRTPTLVSDIMVNREVTQGLCQYFKPLEDEKVLAEKILKCLLEKRDEEKLKKISMSLKEEYHYINVSKQYMELFKKTKQICD